MRSKQQRLGHTRLFTTLKIGMRTIQTHDLQLHVGLLHSLMPSFPGLPCDRRLVLARTQEKPDK